MKPPARAKTDFERVPKYDDWIKGKILDIEYDENHKSVYQGEERVRSCVRFKFELEGCKFSHRSAWMTFSYSEKSNLYKKFISVLVEDAEPDMDFDLDGLKDLEVKTMWTADGDYDRLEMIRTASGKLVEAAKSEEKVEDVPF